MLIQGTPPGASTPHFYPVHTIRRIKENGGSTSSVIQRTDGLAEEVTDTMATIFNRQNVSSKDLGIIMVTEVQKAFGPILTSAKRKIILPTSRIKQVMPLPAPAVGSTVIMFDGEAVEVEETVATILALQSTLPVQLGFLGVTRTSDSKLIIVNYLDVEKIVPKTTPANGSVIIRKTEGSIEVNDTAAAIAAAIP
jgi:hypothetical protein